MSSHPWTPTPASVTRSCVGRALLALALAFLVAGIAAWGAVAHWRPAGYAFVALFELGWLALVLGVMLAALALIVIIRR
jgi:hypothetical protein